MKRSLVFGLWSLFFELWFSVFELWVLREFNWVQQNASPQRGEMFIAWRSLLYFEAPEERKRFCLPRQGFRCRVSLLPERDLSGMFGAMNISLLRSEKFKDLRPKPKDHLRK
jgi:hypothetical protein